MQALNNNKLAWSLVEQAVAAGASDLHLEPMRDAVRVRIRVDGLLRELVRLPLAAHSTLVTQLKVAANMDIAEKRVPQDGRIALELDGRSVDLRLSTLPTTLGEKIAIRLLAQQELLQLEELGFTVTDEYYAERCNGGHYTRFLPPLMGGAPSAADVERVHDRKKALYSDFLDAVRPNTALMEILKTMRAAGHDLACVTTGSKQNATEVLEHFGLREWFGLLVTGEDVEKQKPDPEGYCRAMEHFHVTPADTMIFEDSGIGLTAANASGARVFRVERF